MVAHGRTIDEIAAELGADSLGYLSLEGVYEAIDAPRDAHCDACFSGDFPLEKTLASQGKFALEASPR
jgi:amidophosphoribosyltransferase